MTYQVDSILPKHNLQAKVVIEQKQLQLLRKPPGNKHVSLFFRGG